MSYAGIFTDKNNVDHPVTAVLYGTCATAADTAAKVVTCTDFDTLMTGVTIRVKFTNGNSASNPTININSTGAKSVYRFGSTAPVGDNSWEAGSVVELTYDGTSFFMTGADDIGALYNALDTKQPITDNTLQTTSKTVPGAINEVRSGLTNVVDCIGWDNHKNLLKIYTLSQFKEVYSGFTWDGDNLVINGITMSFITDGSDNVNAIKFNGTLTGSYALQIQVAKKIDPSILSGNILNGCPAGGSSNSYRLVVRQEGSTIDCTDTGNGATIPTIQDTNREVVVLISPGATVSNIIFYPMIRKASDTDPTFQPYHPVIGPAVNELLSVVGALKFNSIKTNATTTATCTLDISNYDSAIVCVTNHPDGVSTASGGIYLASKNGSLYSFMTLAEYKNSDRPQTHYTIAASSGVVTVTRAEWGGLISIFAMGI